MKRWRGGSRRSQRWTYFDLEPLSTLLCAHATVVDGDRVELRFPAKSGQASRADHLLASQDDRGWHPLSAADINDDVRERTGGEFSAKDFRTLHARGRRP